MSGRPQLQSSRDSPGDQRSLILRLHLASWLSVVLFVATFVLIDAGLMTFVNDLV